ncbi:MAG: pyridoxamine 5'-phosphate oxidase family protein [Candidatus Sphingomonas colombiensis]|nr:pyridoxamine 5'-phosphate oxidase family protein [Sphingomonas sp.]WEK43392.1 MAG: pyridoxamine 5'-phosphate oxidase family protein [Sphingomonas sp.]
MTDAQSDAKKLKSDLWKRMAESPLLMVGPADGGTHSEPLTAQLDKHQVDTLFFFVGRSNRIAKAGALMLQFVSKGHDFFACLHGEARVDNDRTQIDKLWNKQVEAWFPDGKDDPNLILLRVDIDNAELWETDISIAGRIKMIFGGAIRSDDGGHHAKVEKTAKSR